MICGISITNPATTYPDTTMAAPIAAPMDKDPTLPKNILAGYLLYHRKPKVAPKIQLSVKTPSLPAIMNFSSKLASTIADSPDARPLNPECMFTRFADTITYTGTIMKR